jgi:hypothetical protein
MIDLARQSGPSGIALPYGLTVIVKPLTTAGMAAAQAAARRAIEAIERQIGERREAGLPPDGLPDLAAEGKRDGFYQAQLLLACRGQLRLAPSGHVIGIDMGAALKLGISRGCNLPVLSELLPAAEAGVGQGVVSQYREAWLSFDQRPPTAAPRAPPPKRSAS